MNLHKHVWTEALLMDDFRDEGVRNKDRLEKLVSLAEGYERRVKEETELTKEQLKTRYVGKVDPKKREYNLVTFSHHFPRIANTANRPRRRRPAAHRRQHRLRLTANDRQGSQRAQVKRPLERHGERRRGRGHGGLVVHDMWNSCEGPFTDRRQDA